MVVTVCPIPELEHRIERYQISSFHGLHALYGSEADHMWLIEINSNWLNN